jgi:hypothetical protein
MQILIDLVRALKGLSRLLRFDPSYRNYFDTTVQGTWRSFFAMMLVAPTVALTLPDNLGKVYPNATQFEFFAVQVLVYVIGWVGNPVVAFEIGRWLKRTDAMPSYITVYNWFQLINLPFALLDWSLSAAGMEGLGALLFLIYLAIYSIYLFYLARSFLKTEAYGAAAFVAADLSIFILLMTATHAILSG